VLPEVDPILPKLVRDVPRGRGWLYELKLDGFRGTLYVKQQRGRFLSKTKKRMKRFDALANAIARELGVRDAILDGEIVS
jgi:bifunctional non-homologous end joining protein LigD